MNYNRKGTLAVVMLAAFVTAGIVTAITSLLLTQRRINIQKELQLQATGVAEAAGAYAYSNLVNEIDAKTIDLAPSIPKTGYKTYTLSSSALAFLKSKIDGPTGATSSITFSDPEVRILAPTAEVSYFTDPKDPNTENDKNPNQWVFERLVPIVVKVTAKMSGQSFIAYLYQTIGVRQIPMFQHAIFFSGQLQLHRGYHPLGAIHSNGPLLLNAHDGDDARYTGFMSTANRFYRGSTIDGAGSGADGYGYTRINTDKELDITIAAGGVKLDATGSTKISLYAGKDAGVDLYPTFANVGSDPFDSRMPGWHDLANSRFGAYLRDKSHEVQTITPIGSAGYAMDVESTDPVNEFSNGPYSLIEPLLPKGHAAYKSTEANSMNLEARASLILRLEYDPLKFPSLAKIGGGALAETKVNGDSFPTDWSKVANPTAAMVVRAYKYSSTWVPGANSNPVLTPVRLPAAVVGTATSNYSGVVSANRNRFETYKASGTKIDANSGFHDARLGRGVSPLAIDIAALKTVMEAKPSDLANQSDKDFRTDFSLAHPTANPHGETTPIQWNGLIYVEIPTSLTPDTDTITGRSTVDDGGIKESYRFLPGSAELRHPDRNADTDSRENRTDKIVPIAPELRRFPSAQANSDITKQEYAIPAVLVINGGKLPNPQDSPGFSIATNAPLYLVGSYNADGDYATGTHITSTAIDDYSDPDPGWDDVQAALFCDSFTVLSDEWKIQSRRRDFSFDGTADASDDRKVPLDGTKRIEIGASIATGEYPIFEFFLHALENFQTIYNTGKNPIIIKGSMVGMFHSEIQHFKNAYGRAASKDIQVYYTGHGNSAIPTVRFSQALVDGKFPPGTPRAIVPSLTGYRLLRPGKPDDKTILTSVGFTAPW